MAWQPNIDARQAIDPARLKFSNRISGHLIQQSLEYQELVVGTDRLGNLSIEGPFIQAVVNSLDGLVHVVRVFLGDLNILPSSGIGEVAADKVVEFVGEDFVEHLQILVEVGRQIEVLKRYVSRRHRVYSHQEFRFWDKDEKIAFVGVVVMPREFHGLAAQLDRLRGIERDGWNQAIRVVHFLKKVADGIEGDDLQARDVLKRYGAADVIFVNVGIDQHLDRLVRDLSDGFWNVFAIAGRRIENDDARVGHKESGLPAVVRKCVNTVSEILHPVSDCRIDVPVFRSHRRQHRNVFEQRFWRIGSS